MNCFSLRTLPALVVCAFVAVTSSQATTITFNSIVSSGNPAKSSLPTDGFIFTPEYNLYTIDHPTTIGFGGAVSDNTIFIAALGGVQGQNLGQYITMAASDGGAFSLTSLCGSKLFMNSATAAAGGFPNAASLKITGNLSGGGTVSTTFTLGSSFQQFFLPSSFTGLSSVVFFGVLDSGLPGGAFSVDNITVNSASVPDGGYTVILLAVTLVGLGLARKKLNQSKPVLKPIRNRR